MASDDHDYKELVASRSPSSAGFSIDGGRAVLKLLVSATDLYDQIKELLGTCQPKGDGALKRRLPKGHPVYQWMYAERISDLVGIGQPSLSDSDPYGILEADALDQYANYSQYLMTVEFTPRLYRLCKDEQITLGTEAYADINDDTTTITYANEWVRFTDKQEYPAGEFIEAQQGQYIFRTSDGTPPNGYSAGMGRVKMFKQMSTLKVQWYQVPEIYIDHEDSYIKAGLGCTNQHEWNGYAAGTLVYQGCSILKRYTPAVPDFETQYGTILFAANKLLDLEFTFSLAKYPLTLAPVGEGNTIVGSQNGLPWSHTGKWYYVSTNIPSIPDSDDKPIFPSYPFSLLWTDPSV